MNKPKIKLPLEIRRLYGVSTVCDFTSNAFEHIEITPGLKALLDAVNSLAPFLCIPIPTNGKKPDLSGVKGRWIVVWFKSEQPSIHSVAVISEHPKPSDIIAWMPLPDFTPYPDPFKEFLAKNPVCKKAAEFTEAMMRRAFEAGRASR